MKTNDPAVLAEVARTVRGATIAWGGDRYFDFENPDACPVTLEDVAYALAYTVRWRGQTRHNGVRCFFGTGQHCLIGASQIILDGHGSEAALAFLGHEMDEVPLPDMPGPVKPLLGPTYKELAARVGGSLERRFRVPEVDLALIKRYDIRCLVTERRDLLAIPEAEIWANGGSGQTSTEGYEPFEERISPMRLDLVAKLFINMWRHLGGYEPA